MTVGYKQDDARTSAWNGEQRGTSGGSEKQFTLRGPCLQLLIVAKIVKLSMKPFLKPSDFDVVEAACTAQSLVNVNVNERHP